MAQFIPQVLIHNAAAPGGELKLSEEHLEMHMAVDHVGPFLLTKLLAPRLLAAKTASCTPRVVYVSSSVHTLAGVDLAMLCANPDPARYSVYGRCAGEDGECPHRARAVEARGGEDKCV